MEINNARPATAELASLTAAAVQTDRFKERKKIEAYSDVKSDAVYFSPVIRIDHETQAAVIQYRDRETGEVKNEYPQQHDKGVHAYEHASQEREAVKADVEVIRVIQEEAPEPVEKEPVINEEA